MSHAPDEGRSLFDSIPIRSVAVLDTMVTLSEVRYRVSSGHLPPLFQAAMSGSVRLFASRHVYDEVHEHIGEFADSVKLPVEELSLSFERDVLPHVRFVTMTSADPSTGGVTDQDDIPTYQLAALIGPCMVLSRDKHLIKPGIAAPNWHEAASVTRDAAGLDVTVLGAGIGAYGAGAAAYGTIKVLARVLRAPPSAVTVGIAAILAGLFTRDPVRFKSSFRRVGHSALSAFGDLARTQHDALGRIQELAYEEESDPVSEQMAGRILAVAREPLTGTEIVERAQSHYPGLNVPSVKEMRSTMLDHSAFVRRQHNRWELGELLSPQGQE